jgi:hypothetical protein
MPPNSFHQSSPRFSRTAIAWTSLGLWHASCFDNACGTPPGWSLLRQALGISRVLGSRALAKIGRWLPSIFPCAAEIAGARQHDENASVASRRPQEGALRILVPAQQNRRTNVEHQACWVMTGCGREPGGTRVAESGPCVIAKEPTAKRPRLPYPVCLAVESANGDSLRKVVRQLVEGAL